MKSKVLLVFLVIGMLLFGTLLASAFVVKQSYSQGLIVIIQVRDSKDFFDSPDVIPLTQTSNINNDNSRLLALSAVDLEKLDEMVDIPLLKGEGNLVHHLEFTENGLEIDVRIDTDKKEDVSDSDLDYKQ